MELKKISRYMWLMGLLALSGALVADGTGCSGSSSSGGGNTTKYSCNSGGSCAADPNGIYATPNCNNACETAAIKYIFVTSAQYNGNLGGLAGADIKCNIAAAAAGLPGTYTAWLSDNNTNAIDRITGIGPWYLVDSGTKVFSNKVNLQTTPIVPINTDEHGKVIGGVGVWTGTSVGGAASGYGNCSNWTDGGNPDDYGAVGSSDLTNSGWTNGTGSGAGMNCYNIFSLYCLEE